MRDYVSQAMTMRGELHVQTTKRAGALILVAMVTGFVSLMSNGAQAGSLQSYRWKSRVIALLAERADDPRVAEQQKIIASMGQGAPEREIVVLTYAGEDAQPLRRELGTPDDGFAAVLVGKDGGAKLISRVPIAAEKLATTIDAMPMRKDEMRGR
jgi:hypothetical protein